MAARPLTITVINQSGVAVKFGNVNTVHGETISISNGPNPLPGTGAQATLYTENSGLVGPQGSFSYTLQDGSSAAFNFDYNHPYGTGTTYVNVTSPTGYTSNMSVNNLPHHDASCTINLQKLG